MYSFVVITKPKSYNSKKTLSYQNRLVAIFRPATHNIANEVIVNEDSSISVKGNGTLTVQLGYGPRSDGAFVSDSFPLSFGITLKHNEKQELFIADTETIEVDTSSFYD